MCGVFIGDAVDQFCLNNGVKTVTVFQTNHSGSYNMSLSEEKSGNSIYAELRQGWTEIN